MARQRPAPSAGFVGVRGSTGCSIITVARGNETRGARLNGGTIRRLSLRPCRNNLASNWNHRRGRTPCSSSITWSIRPKTSRDASECSQSSHATCIRGWRGLPSPAERLHVVLDRHRRVHRIQVKVMKMRRKKWRRRLPTHDRPLHRRRATSPVRGISYISYRFRTGTVHSVQRFESSLQSVSWAPWAQGPSG